MALEAPLDNRKNVFFRERTLLSGRAVLENQQHRQKRNHRPKSLANLYELPSKRVLSVKTREPLASSQHIPKGTVTSSAISPDQYLVH
jgi:hypothetical protein